ncbi:type II toxin-antitoxin system VapC family toxin [Mesorhizobium sp. M4A.F.Ca.ET.020.02.1.1]|uniref:type II toxin-antitoxin system VapC family toxin n=1 Tax=unclassified Mesorhizobium TaxID=325217 RepID=UPI000FCCB5A5|nr:MULTISPECIES: type II toxin-antitoxin system VapC family toxin [unclassified Mesorhizobium]RUX50305.1 type II toxin-antitoxin system VapC family toxin [Mesorhizobium sp. M4A.F.Ca.ET.050.02.1.1]RVD42676.1 type II toxin-antitoxin system VapC family toxin [Mesorhizobium sp. M4A.F.Ca.ET.020.02.1.1]RWC18983.1 MAG: type II toxin-antitoxin system VapC family toxin [Mesorhizobium sp.]RWD25276.1 MAG: type II toxin-antitoxin system VapC family toxin [Mesorhizobium sp.]TIT72828.1 MAG: PIN domain-conta
MTTDGVLLDTCFMLWLSTDQPVARTAVDKVTSARKNGDVIAVSVMSAWEIGMLVSKGRLPFIKSPLGWFEGFVQAGATSVEGIDSELLVESSFLPGAVHNDPTDRIIIATARSKNLAIITRDRAILAYGAAGFVKTVPC